MKESQTDYSEIKLTCRYGNPWDDVILNVLIATCMCTNYYQLLQVIGSSLTLGINCLVGMSRAMDAGCLTQLQKH